VAVTNTTSPAINVITHGQVAIAGAAFLQALRNAKRPEPAGGPPKKPPDKAGDYVMVRPSLRTKGYFLLDRTWYSYWPFAAGKVWPRALAPVFEPFVPVWVQSDSC
jgi:hypothetical protein